ncbi:MAG: family 43 glycosylhydrolase [Candidatus Lokiarchaeota archaeon]|nr:family 43 glycosylhydrolase [Candidatus Lokiarchaeota archaeon]
MGKLKIPAISGTWSHIFNPNETKFMNRLTIMNKSHWYTNDHCFVRGPDNLWHGYGIIGYNILGFAFSWIIEQNLFHITSDSLTRNVWQEHNYALNADRTKGEQYAWAPHIISKNNLLYMYYAAGNLRPFSIISGIHGRIQLATSEDGFKWKRNEYNPIFSGPGNARDPMIFELNSQYFAYYTTSYNEKDKRSCVAVRTSPDLRHWSGPKIAFIYPGKNSKWAGNTESPFVVCNEEIFYLFVCHAQKKYNLTSVYWSEDPELFPNENHVCDLNTHASEIIFDGEEGWFISNTGWDKKGLFLAPLEWIDN